MEDIKTFIENKNYSGIRQILSDNPALANENIFIPYDSNCKAKAHPLHRICDAVFIKKITDEEAIEIAKIFLEYGANIDGNKDVGEDTPLIAAASLHAENLGIFYIEKGADIFYADKNDSATALHWAAFCGRDRLVKKLIDEKANINLRDTSFNATPLQWAIHTLITNDKSNINNQVNCIILLLKAGADTSALDDKTIQYLQLLAENNPELKTLLK
jgi:ankyrin repeat protein